MDYITPKEASLKSGISERRIQKLCEEGSIEGVIRFSKVWAIPKDAEMPLDGRLKSERKTT
ncbi:DNA-binding protein [Paenibacillus lautus]|uniref:DNA-binding protein n=1 Tax=Paenibacillus lautus TaxID=1401 RepID=UPI001B1CC6A3|nr:DNA-binding protein [Paenibacillus lautus]GIP01528.1 DNA-binding protein [Paenibacillus lautus]